MAQKLNKATEDATKEVVRLSKSLERSNANFMKLKEDVDKLSKEKDELTQENETLRSVAEKFDTKIRSVEDEHTEEFVQIMNQLKSVIADITSIKNDLTILKAK